MGKLLWKIYWANLDPVKDSEQSGTRPVIVISPDEINDFLPIVAVVPLTSLKTGRRIYPTEVLLLKNITGLKKDSIAMSHQIRVLSRERLTEECGAIESEEIKNKIRSIVKLFLDL
jgi:mRNA interferase MazF